MSEKSKSPKHESLWQFIKFTLVSVSVSVVQIVLVNVMYIAMAKGSYLPFFLSNLIANIYGYFVNGRATFKNKAPAWCLAVYIAVITVLILVMTPFQKWLVGCINSAGISLLTSLAPTLGACAAGTVQLAVLFPLEKFVLFKDRSDTNSVTHG